MKTIFSNFQNKAIGFDIKATQSCLCINIKKKIKKHKNFEKIPLDLGEYHSSRGICQNINSPRSRGICNIHASEVKKPPTGLKKVFGCKKVLGSKKLLDSKEFFGSNNFLVK